MSTISMLLFLFMKLVMLLTTCRLGLLEGNLGPFDVFDLRNFDPYSANELDVNLFAVELPNLDALDDSKENPFDVKCLDVSSPLVELDDFRTDNPSLLDVFDLDNIDADCPNLLCVFDEFELEVLD